MRRRRRSRPNLSPALYREWDRVNHEQRQAEKSGDYERIEKAKSEVRRVYNEMQFARLARNGASRNREGLTFDQWASAAGLSGRRSASGAHAAWAKGKNPVSWSRAFSVTMVSNPAGAMDAAEFCETLKSMVDTHGKALSCHSGGMGSHSQVFIDFINLPLERVREKRGGGAEGSNNRMLLSVDGFSSKLGESPPSGKVKVETRISLYGAPPAFSKLRGKSGTPEAMAKYVADFISKVAAEVPGKFTHANRSSRPNTMFVGAHSLFPGAQLSVFGQRWVVRQVDVRRKLITLGKSSRGHGALLDVTSAGALYPVDPASRKYLAWSAAYAQTTDWWTLNADAMPTDAYRRNDVWPVAGDANSVFEAMKKNGVRRTSRRAKRTSRRAR